jgi:hypothetical protein
MKLIESKTLATTAAQIEFTSIPQTPFTDLVLLTSLNGTSDNIAIRFNGTTSGYTFRNLMNETGTVRTYTQAAYSLNGHQGGNTAASPIASNDMTYIPNYAGATNKSISTDFANEINSTSQYMGIVAGLWSNTAAITSITVLTTGGSNLGVGATVSLYGITKGSDGIVTTS